MNDRRTFIDFILARMNAGLSALPNPAQLRAMARPEPDVLPAPKPQEPESLDTSEQEAN